MQQWGWTLDDCGEADLKVYSAWLAENAPAFEMLRRGAAKDYWPVYDTDLTNLSNPNFMESVVNGVSTDYRRLVFALRRNIVYDAPRDQASQALDDSLVILRFGRQLQAKGLLLEQMVGVAIESVGHSALLSTLQESDVPRVELQHLLNRLEAEFDPDRCVIDLTSEKIFWYDRIQRTFTDDGEGGGHALPRGIPYAAGDWEGNLLGVLAFNYPDRRATVEMVDAYFEQTQNALRTPPRQRQDLSEQAESMPAIGPNLMLTLTEPAYDRLSDLIWRMKTHEAAVLTIVAVLRYEREEGQYPVRLNDAVETGLLEELPQDPCGSGALSYHRTSEGFTLYSWGENLKDDSGRQGKDSNGQPRLWQNNGDWVFWPDPE